MDELFKGYIVTKNKASLHKFDEMKKYEEVKDLPEYAGLLSKNTLLIDVDDEKQAEILLKIIKGEKLKCRVVKTTRGMHFYFKNAGIEKNGTNKRLACGINCDIKVGSRNSYAVLKYDGKLREIVYNSGEYQTLPKFLFPIQVDVKKFQFFNMKEGDGRNSVLFAYIWALQNKGFTKEEIKKTIIIINKYVFKEPLDEGELEIILREEAFKQEEINEKKEKTNYRKTAEEIIKENNIINIDGRLHIYQEGVYENKQILIRNIISKKFPNYTENKITDVFKKMQMLLSEKVQKFNKHLIPFKNGIYDLKTDKLLEFSPDLITKNKIPWDYNSKTHCQFIDQSLTKFSCGDIKIRMLLEEVIGSVLYKGNKITGNKAIVLKGNKNNGKSTFLLFIKNMVGRDNYSALDLSELNGRFNTILLMDKLVNLGDDINYSYIKNTSIFKKLVTGELVKGEIKGETPVLFENYAKLLFSANAVPRLGNGRDSDAILKRILIVPFNATFEPNDEDFIPDIEEKIDNAESMEYLIQLGIKGLKRLIKNKGFTMSESVEYEMEEYKKENNPILHFIEEMGEEYFDRKVIKEVYREYKNFCYENNYNPTAVNHFSKEIKNKCGYITRQVRIEGERFRIFDKK